MLIWRVWRDAYLDFREGTDEEKLFGYTILFVCPAFMLFCLGIGIAAILITLNVL